MSALYAISKDAKRDLGRFRTARLRDLKYTAPYMHNGMFKPRSTTSWTSMTRVVARAPC
jgi:hypothetical protein